MPVDSGQQRQDPFTPLRVQIAACGPPVVTRSEGKMEDLVCGTQPVLADRLQQINEVVAPIQEMIMKIEQEPSPLGN
jgi:hypothetical protein